MTPAAFAFRDEISLAAAALGLSNSQLEALVLLTAAHESGGFKFRRQVGGPACGLCQQEPARLEDLRVNVLAYRADLADRLRGLESACGVAGEAPGAALESSDRYAAAICLLQYWRHVRFAPLPALDDLAGQAAYWKRFYNSAAGKGTVEEFIADARRYVLGDL